MLRNSLLFVALIASTSALGASPSHFLNDAIRGDNSETKLGQLIAARGSSAAVRNFGRTLVTDHSKARSQAVRLATRMRVSTPSSLMPEARAEYSKLLRLRGHPFDREVRRYMINDHRKDISEFANQVRRGDRQTAALAALQLPTLRKHLRLAESLPR